MKCCQCQSEIDYDNSIPIMRGYPEGAVCEAKAYACCSCAALHDLLGEIYKNLAGKALVYKDGKVQPQS